MAVLSTVERTLTRMDHQRLTRLLAAQVDGLPVHEALQDLLDASDLVASAEVPADVVTMNSRVQLQDMAGAGANYELTLCYPGEAQPATGCISVLSPVGLALLGLCVGEVARWHTPAGEGAARILAVLSQPEASGDFSR